MACSEFLISAAHKSSGKTTVSIGLARALSKRGLSVQPYKKGPDYIDPMWLASAAGRPCFNLDYNVQTEDEISTTFSLHRADVNLVEGNKGLYDAVDVDGSNSNAALARLLNIPVILVIDAQGITRGVAPLVKGYCEFESVNIAGVILNKTASERHEAKLRAAVEHYTDIPVLGTIRRNPKMEIRERHLGLVPSNEHDAREQVSNAIAEEIAAQIELDMLLSSTVAPFSIAVRQPQSPKQYGCGLKVAIARDEAFGFYYADDLDQFKQCGAELVFFSPIHDSQVPRVDALFIGGGFPESFTTELGANRSMHESIRQFSKNGGIIYAECGGLMYLCRNLKVGDRSHVMVGLVPANTLLENHPSGRGYVRIKPTSRHPWYRQENNSETDVINAHEFHYSHLVDVDTNLMLAYEVHRGFGVNGRADGIVLDNILAAYMHQRHTTQNPWIHRFLEYITTARRRTRN